MSSRLSLRLFGVFEACRAGTILDLTHRKADRLLAFLALRGGFVSRAELEVRFWPEAGSNAMDHGLGELRHRIGAGCLEGRHGQVRIIPAQIACDVWEFDQGITDLEKRGRLRTLASDEEYKRAQDAVAHWGGVLLLAWDSEDWLAEERSKREFQYRNALSGLARFAAQMGRPADAVEWLRRASLYFAPSEDDRFSVIQVTREKGGVAEALSAFETYADLCARRHLIPSDRLRRMAKDSGGKVISVPAMAIAPGNVLPPEDLAYVVRSADTAFHTALRENVGVINVKGAPDTGKASLIARGLVAAQAQGFCLLSTDFREMALRDWDSIERVCRFLMGKAQEWLEPEHSAAFDWDDRRDAQANLTRFVERVLLTSSPQPVCWDLGRVDYLFHAESRNAFFSLLRSWTERRSKPQFQIWRRLLLVEATTLEPSLFISDPARSPFNTGKTITVADLTLTEVQQLNIQLGNPATILETEEIFAWLDGHPLLTHQTLVEMRDGSRALSDWRRSLLRDDGPFGEHLRAMRYWLEKRPDLVRAVSGVLSGKRCGDAEFHSLMSAGILDGNIDDGPRLRCLVYERYLRQNLAKTIS